MSLRWSRLKFHPGFIAAHRESMPSTATGRSVMPVSDPLRPFRLDRSLQSNVGTWCWNIWIGKLGYFPTQCGKDVSVDHPGI